MEIIIGNDILNKSLPMGIVPILFSAAGAEVVFFCHRSSNLYDMFGFAAQKAPTMYDTTICCKIQGKKEKVHNILH